MFLVVAQLINIITILFQFVRLMVALEHILAESFPQVFLVLLIYARWVPKSILAKLQADFTVVLHVGFLHTLKIWLVYREPFFLMKQMAFMSVKIKANLLVLVYVAVHSFLYASRAHVCEEFHLKQVFNILKSKVNGRWIAEVGRLRFKRTYLAKAVNQDLR